MKRAKALPKISVPVNLDDQCFAIIEGELQTDEFTSRSDFIRQAIKYFGARRYPADVQSEK